MLVKNKNCMHCIFVVIFFATANNLYAAELFRPLPPPEISIQSGGDLKAAAVTIANFEEKLKSEARDGSEFSSFVSNIKNYSIKITQDDLHYSITYEPHQFKDSRTFGGQCAYIVRKSDFKIVDIKFYK